MIRAELKYVRVDAIHIDEKYQRKLDLKRIDRLKRAYNRGACKAISLSRRADGTLWDVAADPEQLDQVRMGLQKHKVTPRRVLDTAAGMQAATGVAGGGSGYSATAIRQLSKTRSK